MENNNILQTLDENYIWVIVVAIFIIFTVIGFFVDRNQVKKKKAKKEKKKEEIIEENKEEKNNTVSEPINILDTKDEIKENIKEEYKDDDTSEMSNSFLKEENYDLRSLMKESINDKKEQDSNEDKSLEEEIKKETLSIAEKNNNDSYDRNLEYLLKEHEKPKEEIESIDDFLQRTMREAYQPSPEIEENKQSEIVEPTKEDIDNDNQSVDIDYEDTLPIPIQREDEFSPLEVTVVDPEFYKEYTAKPTVENKKSQISEQKDIDFKPIEDAILESLGKLSETDETKDI